MRTFGRETAWSLGAAWLRTIHRCPQTQKTMARRESGPWFGFGTMVESEVVQPAQSKAAAMRADLAIAEAEFSAKALDRQSGNLRSDLPSPCRFTAKHRRPLDPASGEPGGRFWAVGTSNQPAGLRLALSLPGRNSGGCTHPSKPLLRWILRAKDRRREMVDVISGEIAKASIKALGSAGR